MKMKHNALTKFMFCIAFFAVGAPVFSAGGQLLNSTFFPNPAELAMVHQFDLIGGNLFFNPILTFKGVSYGKTGTVTSNVYDPIPYAYLSERLNDQWVIGLNLIPSVYGALNWGENQFVSYSATKTDVLYYRFGTQVSYQITDRLTLGLGGNLERNALTVDFVAPQLGSVSNKSSQYNYTFDLGLFYQISPRTVLTLAGYSPVYRFAQGTSQSKYQMSDDYKTLNVDASVVYLGLNHFMNDEWETKAKIFFSNWSVFKYIYLLNTLAGDQVLPAFWKNVWSFQWSNDYLIFETLKLTGEVLYETNPVIPERNYLGFPLSSAIAATAACEYQVLKPFYIKVMYSYGTFLPDAHIAGGNDNGMISANLQSVTLQGRYSI